MVVSCCAILCACLCLCIYVPSLCVAGSLSSPSNFCFGKIFLSDCLSVADYVPYALPVNSGGYQAEPEKAPAV